jgi:hypothetical protein
MAWTPPAAPSFDPTYTYLVGTSATMDETGTFTLLQTVVTSEIIGIADAPTIYNIHGYAFSQVNVMVPGLILSFVSGDYPTLLAQWQEVVQVIAHPSSIPANEAGLNAAIAALKNLQPPTE